MWWKPALSPAEVLWSSGFRVIEPSSQTIRVSSGGEGPRVEVVSRRRTDLPVPEAAATPEDLLERVAELVHERQVLRAAGAGRAELERNRAEIARAQWDLSRALIVRHHR